MREYHSRMSLGTAPAVSTTLVQPAPTAEDNSRPTRFKRGNSVHTNNPSPQEFSVEVDFDSFEIHHLGSLDRFVGYVAGLPRP